MEISLEQLLEGKAIKIKNKDFLQTKAYVEPFLERMRKFTSDFRVQVKLPELITLNDPDEGREPENLSYTRVAIQGVLPDTWENHSDVIGMGPSLSSLSPVTNCPRRCRLTVCRKMCLKLSGWCASATTMSVLVLASMCAVLLR